MERLRRRAALRALAAVGVGAIAGCNDSGSGSDDGGDGGGGGGGNDGQGTAGNETGSGPGNQVSLGFLEKVTAADRDREDNFGRAVAIEGDTAVITAPRHDQPHGRDSGSAYVFRRAAGGWQQEAKLASEEGATGDKFGNAVTLWGNTAVLGAAAADRPHGTDCGSVFVFQHDEGEWRQATRLVADDGQRLDAFGTAIAGDGETLVVGAPGHAGNNGNNAGGAYIFEPADDGWIQRTKLAPIRLDRADRFGGALGLGGDTLLVGASGDEDPNGSRAGTVYPYERVNGSWERRGQIVPDDGDTGHRFGRTIAQDGERAVIAAPSHRANGADSGAAYVFERTDGSWAQRTKLLPDDGDAGDRFGHSAALLDDVALVGAPLDDDPHGTEGGAAYLFQYQEGTWSQRLKVSARHGRADEHYGWAVALSSGAALAGVPREVLPVGQGTGAAHFYRWD